jgi:hypothetical protein
MRASGLKSPYQVVRSDDPREQMRIKSLQLLCFKLASHKDKVDQMLERHLSYQDKTDDLIPFLVFKDVMTEFSQITGIVFM